MANINRTTEFKLTPKQEKLHDYLDHHGWVYECEELDGTDHRMLRYLVEYGQATYDVLLSEDGGIKVLRHELVNCKPEDVFGILNVDRAT